MSPRNLRLLLTAVGSRGDVEPRVALAQELRRRGHEATVACATSHRPIVERYGLEWALLGDHPPASVSAPVYASMADEPDPGRRGELLLRELLVPMLPEIRQRLEHMATDFDLVVLNDLLTPFALPPVLDAAAVAVALTTQPVGGFALMLAGSPVVKLVGSSPLLLPEDHGLDDTFVVTDFWAPTPNERFMPDPDLGRFISGANDERPLVAVTVGSAWGTEPRLSFALLAAAARRAGVRLLVQDGGGGASCDDVASIGEVPYRWLFERVDAVVHHAGAGTIAETLRAGLPSVSVPHYGDHRYWAGRLEAVGVSAGTLIGGDLTEANLAAHLDRVVRDDGLQARARALAAGVDIAAGISRACDCLETPRPTVSRGV